MRYELVTVANKLSVSHQVVKSIIMDPCLLKFVFNFEKKFKFLLIKNKSIMCSW